MPVSVYTASIPVLIKHLNGLNTVLDKAAAWAAARKVTHKAPRRRRADRDAFYAAIPSR